MIRSKRHSRACPFLLLSLLAAGCGRGGPPPVVPAAPPPPAPLARLEAAQRLYYDDGGGIPDSLRMTIRDPLRFREIWDRATSTLGSPPPLPSVDFEREMILVVAAGRMNAGDRVQVDSAGVREELDPDGARREVFLAQVRIIEDCSEFRADIYPVEIVRVRRFEGPVQFLHLRERGAGCMGAAAPSSRPRILPGSP